jgi:GNAT superfamily N-acetyltransferase
MPVDRSEATGDNGGMSTILQLQKRLDSLPQSELLQNVTVKTYSGDGDRTSWLTLRDAAFAKERIGVRKWDNAEFVIEFSHMWWWTPQRMWFAIADGGKLAESGSRASNSPATVVGSVTLAMRGTPEAAKPVVHWLMVHPRWRRRGIARLLMSQLEQAAWEAGHREIFLETHSAWQAAARFYKAMGYEVV